MTDLKKEADFAFDNILKCEDESLRPAYTSGYGDGYRRGKGIVDLTTDKKEARTPENIGFDVAYKWKLHWQNKEPGYFGRAFGIDSNMIHHLGDLIGEAIKAERQRVIDAGPCEEELEKLLELDRDASRVAMKWVWESYTKYGEDGGANNHLSLRWGFQQGVRYALSELYPEQFSFKLGRE